MNRDALSGNPFRLILVLVTLLVCVLAACSDGSASAFQSKSDVDAWVGGAIPKHAAKEKVFAFLDANKVEHSQLMPGNSGNVIYGIVRDVRKNGLITTDVQMIFEFDPGGTLTSYTSREVHTGP